MCVCGTPPRHMYSYLSSIYRPGYLSVDLSVYLHIYQPIYVSFYLLVYLAIYLSPHYYYYYYYSCCCCCCYYYYYYPSIHLSIYICEPIGSSSLGEVHLTRAQSVYDSRRRLDLFVARDDVTLPADLVKCVCLRVSVLA